MYINIYIYVRKKIHRQCERERESAGKRERERGMSRSEPLQASSALQHTATHCNTLPHTAIHCSALPHTATHCHTLQHPSTLGVSRWSPFPPKGE